MNGVFSDNAIVLKAEPYSEFDRRLVLLTKDHGKVTAFAKGARRKGNRFTAGTDYFCFGKFQMYTGANSYSLGDVHIVNYFEELRLDMNKCMYGMYFLEVCDFLCREENDEEDMLVLLYQSLRALISDSFNNTFVKLVFELKTMMLGGEFNLSIKNITSGASYTLNYLYSVQPKKVFSFNITPEIFRELTDICEMQKKTIWKHKFNSEDLLKTIENC